MSTVLAPPTQLTQGGLNKFSPVFTPDGSKILFADGNDQLPLSRDVFVVDSDGQNLTQLTHGGPRLSWMPAVAPCGDSVVYTQELNGQADLHRVNLDGTHDQNITGDNKGYWETQWSPDGKSLLCTTTAPGDGNLHLMVLSPDGKTRTVLTPSGTGDNRHPLYTVDGSHIVFISNREDGEDEVYAMKADGTDVKRLSPGLPLIDGPAVSSRGEVAFVSQSQDGQMHLETVNLNDGKPPTDLMHLETLLSPTWSPDGEYLSYLADDANGKMQVWEADPDGTHSHQLTGDNGFHPYATYTPWGDAMIYVNDGPHDSEIYSIPLDDDH